MFIKNNLITLVKNNLTNFVKHNLTNFVKHNLTIIVKHWLIIFVNKQCVFHHTLKINMKILGQLKSNPIETINYFIINLTKILDEILRLNSWLGLSNPNWHWGLTKFYCCGLKIWLVHLNDSWATTYVFQSL